MNRAGIFQGMSGNKSVPMSSIQASAKQAGRGHSYNDNATIGYVGYKVAPAMFSQVIDYSSRRGVLPCYGITHHVLRNPPQYIAQHGLIPQGGQSRSQNQSVVNPRPLNLPIMMPRSNMNGGLPSNIPMFGLARKSIRAM